MSTPASPAPDSPAHPAQVYTVAPGKPFLDAIVEAILNGELPRPAGRAPHPLELPDITILLPTRRAARALQQTFLRVSGARALLLPRISPIAEADEELSLIADLVAREPFATPVEQVAPAIGELERRLTLTELVLAWSTALRRPGAGPRDEAMLAAGARSPAQAQQLAAELSRLMDMLETESVPLSRLDGLVPETFSEHWQQTLDFLRIITEAWPRHLAETERISPVARRNAVLCAEARRLATSPPAAPVIVAGVTGSIPATAELMKAVSRLPQGAVVLPGLDLDADAETIAAIAQAPEHPQFTLHRLLSAIEVRLGDVGVLGTARATRAATRAAFVREAMRPAATTARWHDYVAGADRAEIEAALAGITLIEAPSAEDEAEAVSLILREAAETPGRTVALVSPDRVLARRVAIRLQAWGIRVDDSAGRPLAKTVPGTFLDLTIAAAATDFAPAATMALLKHPLARLGLDVGAARRAARALEIAAFRTVYLGRGLDGIEAALERAARDSAKGGSRRDRGVRRIHDDGWNGARELLARLRAAFAPLAELFAARGPLALRDLAEAHVAAAEALAQLPDAASDSPLWEQEAGQAATTFFARLLDPALRAPRIAAADYADLYRSLVAGETVRARVPVHPRIFIWGPFEARLQRPDIVVLGSLNDGTWPEAAEPGPWLNRPMRQALGLPSPEEAIGRAAHDFVSLLEGSRVYLTRAKKVVGVPTVPSRWLMRMTALLGGMGLGDALRPEQPWLGFARARDTVVRASPLRPPAPKPPLALRPRRISVSGAETWMANPYAVFAREILKLEAMPPLGIAPDAALRGSIVHEALGKFAARYPRELPADPQAALREIIAAVLAEYTGNPRVAAFWLPRLERFAAWFAETEAARRHGVREVLAEQAGTLVLAAPGGPFTLTARADRIDVTADGLVITDYKTGSGLSALASRAQKGRAPQLPLEAAMAREGGFAGVDVREVKALRYISASGGEPAGDARDLKCDDLAGLAKAARDGLAELVALFDDQKTAYRAVRRAAFSYDYDEYAHLARVKEWSADAEGGEEAA